MNDMLGVFVIYQMGVKYNIGMKCRFACNPHSDFAGFCDPTSRLPGYIIPLPYEFMCTHIWVGANLNTPTFLSWKVMFSHFMIKWQIRKS